MAAKIGNHFISTVKFESIKLVTKIPGCEIQDKSTSISIEVKFVEMSESDDGDESDKHI